LPAGRTAIGQPPFLSFLARVFVLVSLGPIAAFAADQRLALVIGNAGRRPVPEK
jgi:hypothetical protein